MFSYSKKTERRRITFYSVYLIAYLLIMAICAKSEALANNGVVISFVKISQAYPLLAVTIFGIIYILLKKRVVLDSITALLLGRIVLCAIPAILTDVPSSYVGNFIVACFPLLIYTFFLSCDMEISKVAKLFVIFGLVIAIQCIWAYIVIRQNGYAEYGDPFYKNYFVIPVGATNNISAVLIPLIIFGDQTIEKKRFKYFYVALLLVALFLCKSRTGVILAVSYIIVRLFTRNDGKHSWIKKMTILLLPMIILLMVVVLKNTEFADSIVAFFWGYAEVGEGWEGLLSDRIVVFSNAIEKIYEHLIIGNGVTYEKLDYMRTHNVFLQMLYENGIFGLIGFLIFLTISIQRIAKAKSTNRYFYAFAISAPFIFINALVEETMLCNFMMLYGLFFLAKMKEENCEDSENV